MKILQSLEIILAEQNPEASSYLKSANEYKNTNLKISAVNIRFFLENIVKDMMNRENLSIKGLNTLSEKIQVLKNEGILDEEKYKAFHKARKVGNKGAHENEVLKKYELENALEISSELGKFYVKKYLLKHAIEHGYGKYPYGDVTMELPEIQEHQKYIFQCEKPECRMYMGNKKKLKLCLKCGGPVKFKDIVVNVPNGPNKDTTVVNKTKGNEYVHIENGSSINIPNSSIQIEEIPKRYKFEIYDKTLELVKEVNLTKDEIIIGRKSESFTNVDIDLKDYSLDPKSNEYMISRYQAHVYKKGEDYYMQSKSKTADIIINDTKLQCDGELVKLEDKDLIKINEVVAFIYLVY